jgi:hypothetical protein
MTTRAAAAAEATAAVASGTVMLEPTVEEVVAAVAEAVRVGPPSLASRFDAVVEFRLTPPPTTTTTTKAAAGHAGPEADGTRTWTVDITRAGEKGRQGGGPNGRTPPPDLTVTTSLDVFRDLLNRRVTPQRAFAGGTLKVRGRKMGRAMKLNLVLDATREVLLRQRLVGPQGRGREDGGENTGPMVASSVRSRL